MSSYVFMNYSVLALCGLPVALETFAFQSLLHDRGLTVIFRSFRYFLPYRLILYNGLS